MAAFAPSAAGAADKPKDALALPREGFACCNLHYDGDWINDGNYASLPMIAVGTPIKVVSLGHNKAHVLIDGKKMRLGHDYGREQESLEAWVAKIVVLEDPRPLIATYPADIQGAIRQGQVVAGMTRQQAVQSIGYPLTSENPSFDGPLWRHWLSSFEEYQLSWGSDGKLKDIVADAPIRNRVVYSGSN
ncbi:MAG: hypothetical protein JSR95_05535 [Proteobacteria bacterium]|nr:hypothetical protein [Pseudomonadota bacterium]